MSHLEKFKKYDGYVLNVNGRKLYALSDNKIDGIEYSARYLTGLNVKILQEIEEQYPNKSKMEILNIAKNNYELFNVSDFINRLNSDISRKLADPEDEQLILKALVEESKEYRTKKQNNLNNNLNVGFSDKDKIKYFKKRVNDMSLTPGQRNYADIRLKVLTGN